MQFLGFFRVCWDILTLTKVVGKQWLHTDQTSPKGIVLLILFTRMLAFGDLLSAQNHELSEKHFNIGCRPKSMLSYR